MTFADYLERVEAKIEQTTTYLERVEAVFGESMRNRDWGRVAKLAVELEGYDVFLRHLDELSKDLKEAIERNEE
jgi:hypothetical protein